MPSTYVLHLYDSSSGKLLPHIYVIEIREKISLVLKPMSSYHVEDGRKENNAATNLPSSKITIQGFAMHR